jgi:hypothetical protein
VRKEETVFQVVWFTYELEGQDKGGAKARHQWLTSVVRATREAKIRITVGDQPRLGFTRLHLQNNQSKMDWECGSNNRESALQI